jgi:hypothetical protein
MSDGALIAELQILLFPHLNYYRTGARKLAERIVARLRHREERAQHGSDTQTVRGKRPRAKNPMGPATRRGAHETRVSASQGR